jgi:hypothetical protein
MNFHGPDNSESGLWVTNDRFPMSAECPLFPEAEEAPRCLK